MSRALNEHSDMTARFDALVAATAVRYGANSQGMVFVLYDELRALRTALVTRPGSVVLSARIATVREQIQRIYDRSAFPPLADVPVTVVQADPVVLEYSRTAFDLRYAGAARAIHKEIITVTDSVIHPLQAERPYMFVIDDHGRLLVWNRAFHFGDLIFGRNRATVDGTPVAHPMLVPDRLRAKAAGEIIFIGSPTVSAVIANTKSGHFRPPPATTEVIRSTCREVLQLRDRDMDLFALGPLVGPCNDGATATRSGRCHE